MRGLMAGFRKLQNNGVVVQRGLTFWRASSVLAVASIMAFAPAFAKDSDEKEGKPKGNGPAVKIPNREQVAVPAELRADRKIAPARAARESEANGRYYNGNIGSGPGNRRYHGYGNGPYGNRGYGYGNGGYIDRAFSYGSPFGFGLSIY